MPNEAVAATGHESKGGHRVIWMPVTYLAERVEALEAQQALRAQEMAALEAERDELRKRPTLEEVLRAVTQWDYDNRHALSTWADTEPEDKTLDARMRALYAAKAAQ